MKYLIIRRTLSIVALAALVMITNATENVAIADGEGASSLSATYNAQSLPENIPGLVDAEKYDAAIDALNTFIDQENRNADAWNLLGYSLRKVEQYEDSLRAYKKALKLDRKHLGAREYLGELYLTLGKPKKAKSQLKKLKRYCGSCDQYTKLAEAIKKHEEG